jgi:hypothetical protein
VVKVYCKGKYNLMSDIYKRNNAVLTLYSHPLPLDKRTGRQYKQSYQVSPLWGASPIYLVTWLSRRSCDYRSAAFYMTGLPKYLLRGVLHNTLTYALSKASAMRRSMQHTYKKICYAAFCDILTLRMAL